MAVPSLQNLVLFIALPCFGDVRAVAVDAAVEITADDRTFVGRAIGFLQVLRLLVALDGAVR